MSEVLQVDPRAAAAPHERRGWGPAHVLAALGVVLLFVQAWTWVAWLADGPSQVTQYQDPDDFTFKAARVMEWSAGFAFVAMAAWLIRRCYRERKLVFDAMLFVAGLSALWLDALTNSVAPIWLYNTNFTNTPPPTAYMPGVVNPVIENMPFPTLFHLFNYPVACLGAGIVVSALVGRLRRRFPTAPAAGLIVGCAVAGMVFDIAYESFMLRAGMWAFPGTPDELAIWGNKSYKFPIFEIVPAGLAFAAFGALRSFRNDRGEHLTERNLGSLPPRRRAGITLLATIGAINAVWIVMCLIQVVGGFYADPYKPMPRTLVANICDTELENGRELTTTPYGPCPEQGSRIPIRKLPANGAE